MRYFNGDVDSLLANTTAVCVRNMKRSCGLRVSMKYLERRAPVEILRETGISVHRSSGETDVCEDLMGCLARGALGIVKLDCFFIKRQRDLFQKKHGEHTILVCGYDLDRRVFEIIDNEAARDVLYRRTTIEFDELRQAYGGLRAHVQLASPGNNRSHRLG